MNQKCTSKVKSLTVSCILLRQRFYDISKACVRPTCLQNSILHGYNPSTILYLTWGHLSMRKTIYDCDFCYGWWFHGFINNQINIKLFFFYLFKRLLILQGFLVVSKDLQGYLSLWQIENCRPSKINYGNMNNEIMTQTHRGKLRDMDKDYG